MFGRLLSFAAAALVGVVLAESAIAQPNPTSYTPARVEPVSRSRVLVLTDIGNEPDDAESMVRFLLYVNEFDVEGLFATTSRHLRDQVNPDQIRERVEAYGQVLRNLRVHAPSYPTADFLNQRIVVGRVAYGMEGVGEGKDTPASEWLINAVDKPDPRPLWVLIWGGAVDLAQALHHVRATRPPEQVRAFVSKLRVYSISDQDDAGPWIRHNFQDIWWIVSQHAHRHYSLATWAGISGEGLYLFDAGGPDTSLVANEWLDQHVRLGPLGALYPRWEFIMEGDTPSFLYLIPNGLGAPDHPEYGSWGGRYGRMSAYDNIWTDVSDFVIGQNGRTFRTNFGTIWRWRQAYQNDFAARIQWTLQRRFRDANHNPTLVVNGLRGRDPLAIDASPGATVLLDASGSGDPDGDQVDYRWFQYRESEAVNTNAEVTITHESPTRVSVRLPDARTTTPYHVVVEAKDRGDLPLYSYRRVIIRVAPTTTLSPTR